MSDENRNLIESIDSVAMLHRVNVIAEGMIAAIGSPRPLDKKLFIEIVAQLAAGMAHAKSMVLSLETLRFSEDNINEILQLCTSVANCRISEMIKIAKMHEEQSKDIR